MSDARIFVSFDPRDADLFERLREQAAMPSAGFEVSTHSEPGVVTERWEANVRRRMMGVDAVIVVCGERTQDSMTVGSELRIAQEEEKPYFLLWGRRESMCTRPASARSTDGMYSWTWEILRNQIIVTLRNAEPRPIPESCKRRATAT